jgi:hypothetical protein
MIKNKTNITIQIQYKILSEMAGFFFEIKLDK